MQCTIKRYLKIVPGEIADYKPLARFHYRDSRTGPVAAVYKIIDTHPVRNKASMMPDDCQTPLKTRNQRFLTATEGGLSLTGQMQPVSNGTHPARVALYGCGCATRIGCVERKSSFDMQPTDVMRNEQRNLMTNTDSCEPVVGIIIYSMPACSVQLRNIATKGLFTKLGSANANMQLVNQNIRTIARVVIEPRYRALGLSYELVKKTMPLLNMPYIEALAVMGKVNPFFEKAGMMKFEAPEPLRSVKLQAALSTIGIEQTDLVDIEKTHNKLQSLNRKAKSFIEKQITDFLAAYGRRARFMRDGLQRTEFFISRLSERPVYYLWRNSNCDLKF